MPPRKSFREQCVALAWGAWSELGVSGWPTTHRDWAIDPEPLILLTAWLKDADRRLRDEATDWCVRYERRISKARLKNLVAAQPDDVRAAYGVFAATVSAHVPSAWPGATSPRTFRPTGRSSLPSLDRPSLAWLRMRAVFGLGARAEVLRYLLANRGSSGHGLSAAVLARRTGYAKRIVADECDSLNHAGLLTARAVGNRFTYSLTRPSRLADFVGELPSIQPDWTAVGNVARVLTGLDDEARTRSARTLPVAVRRALGEIEDDLHDVEADPVPDSVVGPGLWPAAEQLGKATLGRWARGQWTA
ncbi:MAG: hypothetical protein QOK43_510 [Acidimicrobiaceae bacterium]|nr:hypothetical protein [Acidimicrobiaceae bacterium]